MDELQATVRALQASVIQLQEVENVKNFMTAFALYLDFAEFVKQPESTRAMMESYMHSEGTWDMDGKPWAHDKLATLFDEFVNAPDPEHPDETDRKSVV